MDFLAYRLMPLGACLLCGFIMETGAEDICWSTFGHYQYKVLTTVGGVSFSTAIDACEQENTTLASVLSHEEDLFLQTFAMSQIGVPVWIGLYRKDQNLSWIDGSDIGYISRNYRRKAYEESCVYMFQGWIEAHCQDAELYFICKREVVEANTCLLTSSTTIPTSEGATDIQEAGGSGTTLTQPTEEPTSSDSVTGASGTSSYTEPDLDTQTTDTAIVTNTDTPTTSTDVSTTDILDEPETTDGVTLNTGQTEYTTHTSPTSSGINLDTTNTGTSGINTKPSSTNAAPPIVESTIQPEENGDPYDVTTPTWEVEFEDLIKEMTVKKKPVYTTTEAKNSTAIGSVSILILVGIVCGVVLLDITTIRNHLRLFQSNTKGFCSNCRKGRKPKQSDIIIELVDIIDN